MIISRPIHVAANSIVLFLFMAESLSSVPLCKLTTSSLSVLSVGGHLGCSHILAVVTSAAVNIEVHVFFQTIVFSGCMPRCGVSGSYGISVKWI